MKMLNFLKTSRLKSTLVGALLLLFSQVTLASALSISPMKLDFRQGNNTVSLALTNKIENDLPIQVKVFEWSQDDSGQSVLTPTRDILFTPPIVRVPPLERQIIRFRLRRGADKHIERTYRVIIEQLLPKGQNAEVGSAFKIRVSLPIFVAPLKAERRPSLSTNAVDEGFGKLKVSLTNVGNAHTKISGAYLFPANTTTRSAGNTRHMAASVNNSIGSQYLLPGTSASWLLDAGKTLPSGRYNILFTTSFKDHRNVSAIEENGHFWFPIQLQ